MLAGIDKIILSKRLKLSDKGNIVPFAIDPSESSANMTSWEVSFDKVFLIDDGKNVKVGDPKLSGAKVDAKILSHLKGDKVIVFKKKRRKGYRVKNGHRQFLTQILIENVIEKGALKKSEAKTKKVVEPKSSSKDLKSKKATLKKTVSSKTKSNSKKKSLKK